MVVVGAGIGGLSAASVAASAGLRVAVCESHDAPGGAAHEWTVKGFHFESGPFGGIDSPSYVSFEQPPLPGGLWFGLALMAGNVEYLSVATFEPLVEGGIIGEQNEHKLFRIKADHKAGDLGFDPLGLKPTDPAEFNEMATKELQNGRLAMLAAAGFIAQELVNHKPILETLRLLLLLNESEMDKEFGLNLPSGDIATIERELETGAADTFFK